jgi:hypothetical protein
VNLASAARGGPRRRADHVALAAAVSITAAVILAACQPGSSLSGATGAPGSDGVAGGATATAAPLGTFGPPPSPTPPDVTSPVVLDPALLEVLPASIDGFPVTESIDEASLALTDPALPRIASALDAGVAVDTGGGNLVYALVVKLRPEAFNADTYGQWRDSFDEGACAAAGGVDGRAQAQIDERTVYITSCVASLRTYHLWLEDAALLISASSIGEGTFGEKLMGELRVPE